MLGDDHAMGFGNRVELIEAHLSNRSARNASRRAGTDPGDRLQWNKTLELIRNHSRHRRRVHGVVPNMRVAARARGHSHFSNLDGPLQKPDPVKRGTQVVTVDENYRSRLNRRAITGSQSIIVRVSPVRDKACDRDICACTTRTRSQRIPFAATTDGMGWRPRSAHAVPPAARASPGASARKRDKGEDFGNDNSSHA